MNSKDYYSDPILGKTPQDVLRKHGWIQGKLFERKDGEICGCCIIGAIYTSDEGRKLLRSRLTPEMAISEIPLIQEALEKRNLVDVVSFNDTHCKSIDEAIAFLDEIFPPTDSLASPESPSPEDNPSR